MNEHRAAEDSPDTQIPSSPVPPAPRALSPSKIETLQCPHRYQQLYVLGKKPEGVEAVQLAVGTLVHEVAARYVLHLRDEKRATDQTYLASLAQLFWMERPFSVPEGSFDDFNLFISQLEQVVFSPEAIYAAEVRLSFDLSWKPLEWDDPAVSWGGIIDVLEVIGSGETARAHAIDWTTAAISGQFSTKKDLQLRMYGLLVWKLLGIEHVTITTKSLRSGATREVDLDEVDHQETLQRIIGEMGRLGTLLESDERFAWPAIPCSQCGIYSLPCPQFDLSLKTDVPLRLETTGQAEDALRQLVLINSKKTALQNVLKAYCTFKGVVNGAGVAANLWPIEKRTYPTADVHAVLVHELGPAEAFSALKVDRVAAKRLLKRQKDVLTQIEAMATIKTAERFGVKSAKADDHEDGEE